MENISSQKNIEDALYQDEYGIWHADRKPDITFSHTDIYQDGKLITDNKSRHVNFFKLFLQRYIRELGGHEDGLSCSQKES